MSDLQITCPHCRIHITFGVGNDAEEKSSELLGFVLTCPSCQTPMSYQANEGTAIELDKETFDNFKLAMAKKLNQLDNMDGVVFTGPMPATKTMLKEAAEVAEYVKSIKAVKATKETAQAMNEENYKHMLNDIRECDSFDEFLKRVGN